MSGYTTRDSGERHDYDSGMRRDKEEGKPRYDLIDRPFLRRWADLMARGAEKYAADNWRLAESEEELRRFRSSALRHMFQWLEEDDEQLDWPLGVYVYEPEEPKEDHAAAVAFNLAAAEMVKKKLGYSDGA